ncbi:MAG: hypothetical protein Q9200_007827, partial [Gallowayella weberi]
MLSEITRPSSAPPVKESLGSTSTFEDSFWSVLESYVTADNLLLVIGLAMAGGLGYAIYRSYTTPPAAPGAAAETIPEAPVSSDPLLVQQPLVQPAAIPEAPVSTDPLLVQQPLVQEPAPVLGEVAQESVQATPPQIISQAPLETPEELAARVLQSLLSKEAIAREMSRLHTLRPGSDLRLYAQSTIEISKIGCEIDLTRNLVLSTAEQLQGTPEQIALVDAETIAYYNALVPELQKRLTTYYDLVVRFQQLRSTPPNACNLLIDVLGQCLDAVKELKEEVEAVTQIYEGVFMQLMDCGAPVVTFLGPCLGVSLSASLNLLILRFTGSRRLSAPRVSLSLGGLGLSLATSTLLLWLGQPLLVALAAA